MDLVSALLQVLGLGKWVPLALAGVAVVGWLLSHALALGLLPAPKGTGWWSRLYPMLVVFSGSYGALTPAAVVAQVETAIKETKA